MSTLDVNEVKLNLKLMVDTKTKKVVFAEADKNFVDFIFHLLSLPLAKVVEHLKNKGMRGCLGSVFKSFHSLNYQYFEPNLDKYSMFSPNIDVVVPLLSLNGTIPKPSIQKCPTHNHVTFRSGLTCPINGCSQEMIYSPLSYVQETTSSKKAPGFVKAAVHYMVMDDLEVSPMSIALLKYHAIDFGKLEEKVVRVGVKEAIEILKASLMTDAVLTTVFLEKAN